MPLFQKTIIKKYTQELNTQNVQNAYTLYQTYFLNPTIQENIREAKEEQFQEGFLRELFVHILGYTLNPNPNFNLTTELKNISNNKKVDGAILIDNKAIAVIELKGTDTTDLAKIEIQAFNYKNNQPHCIYVITSNFEKLRFYINNAIEYIEFNLFTLTREEFNLLWLCLSLKSIQQNIPKKIKDESLSKEDAITKQLYQDYSCFKQTMFNSLVEKNKQFDKLLLFKKTQKLLDRFLFIFFAEDRLLLPANLIVSINAEWKKLQEMRVQQSLFDRYKLYFNDLNTGNAKQDIYAYNGGLFAPDEVLDNIFIDDDILYTHTQKISNYDFQSEVDVNILGHIFENSLNEIEKITSEIEGQTLDKAKTRRKKDGVFYTPKYITKYIVENTVGKLCTEKKEHIQLIEEQYTNDKKKTTKAKKELLDKLTEYRNWLLQLTICDPACGSGAFLNQALEFLIAEHRYIDELQAKLLGASIILSDIENSILENNLFGVDINDESVEIAQLSLWLRTAQRNRKLNTLNHNIKCGNSLIDDPAVAGEKAFNWQKEFPQVFAKGGFDVVIGNPPYVDIKALPSEIVSILFKEYTTAENRINLYSIFIEKTISIIKAKGILSFITPNSLLLNSSYQKLRNLISDGLSEVVKLSDNVFPDAKVETIIFFFQNHKLVNDVNLILYDKNEKIQFIDKTKKTTLSKIDWQTKTGIVFSIYSNKQQQQLLTKIESNSILLNEIAEFSLGITPYDKYKGHFKEIIENRAFHSKIKIDETYKPLIDGENITRYLTLEHIKEYIKYGDWLGAMRDQRFFTEPRILVRQIVSGSPLRIYASYSNQDMYFTQIGFGIIPKNEIAVKYLLCIINSQLLNFYHKFKFLDIEKDLFQKILIANCKQFPVKIIEFDQQQPFIEKADLMLSLNKELQELSQKFQRTLQRKFDIEALPKKLQDWYTLSYTTFIKELSKKKIKLSLSDEAEWEEYFTKKAKKAQNLKANIDATDREIDQMVYKLYELTEEEIKIVEEK